MGPATGIDDAILAFISATTETDVFRTLTRGTAEVVPADVCKVATVEGGALVPQVRSDHRPVDPSCRLSLAGTAIGTAVTSGTPAFIDDIQFTRSTATSKESQSQDATRAVFSVPVGDDAVLIGSATEPGVFKPSDRDQIKRLVSYAEAALDRLQCPNTGFREHNKFDEFGAIVTHDLRGPLGIARAYAEHSQETGDIDALDDVLEALDRFEQIITDMYILVHTDWEIDDPETVSLVSVASDCWTAVDTQSATLNIDEDRHFCADRSQLRHLCENLFRNAVEHGGNSVRITVGSISDGFYIEDTGSGISTDHREDLFESGFTTSDTGTGYGLAIVKRIVDAHEWMITVTESCEGGARFEITGIQ